MTKNANFKDLTPKRLLTPERLIPIFKKRDVARAILFGSEARGGETKKSDLDLLIVYKTQKRFFDRYDEFEEIYDVMKGRAVDLLIYTPEELASISHRPFIKGILAEGRTIYER